MLIQDAKDLIGKIATLDLISGVTITTKIEDIVTEYDEMSIIEGGITTTVYCDPTFVCSDPIEFQIEMGAPPNPHAPPSAQNQPQAQLVPIPYGAPMYDVKELKISVEHVLASLETPAQYEDAYRQIVSGIVTASANTLDVMKAANS